MGGFMGGAPTTSSEQEAKRRDPTEGGNKQVRFTCMALSVVQEVCFASLKPCWHCQRALCYVFENHLHVSWNLLCSLSHKHTQDTYTQQAALVSS
jgi:hypothetical protein